VKASSAERSAAAARRIERWLLTSPIQLATGPHEGGIAGTLDAEDRPTFVYLEITGYYLTWTAWLLAGGGCLGERFGRAKRRGERALGWLDRVVDERRVPLTRMHLADEEVADWRNAAVFTFDLAMAIRGAAEFSRASAPIDGVRSPVEHALASHLERNRAGEHLQSHRTVGSEQIPQRWSTEAGPHHLKAAACVLSAPVGEPLAQAARLTSARWSDALVAGWPVAEVHPLLYGLEGMLIGGAERLDTAATVFERLMAAQDHAGSLPSQLSGEAIERSDVLAQALRLGMLLRRHGRLQEQGWSHRLDLLADRLITHVHPDGAVGFTHGQQTRNAWCAMFAHQALVWHAQLDEGTADAARRYLV
jgi:hypothetical protein